MINIFKDNKDFYPSPDDLIAKMLDGIDLTRVTTVLEPSSGDGRIVDYLTKANRDMNRSKYVETRLDIDCVELDQNLRYILQGKGYRVVNDDFMTYDTLKNYSLIICNLPFSCGDKHLRKILNMLEYGGGMLSCVVNAETIKNPYSNLRKEIIQILNKNNATIEFLENEFVDADRVTNVEIALIKCSVDRKEVGSLIVETLKAAEVEKENTYESKYIVGNEFIKAIITQYNFEAKAGIKLIEEYNKLESFTNASFDKEDRNGNILSLKITSDRSYNSPCENLLKNEYLKKLRYKYWKALFNNKEFTKLFTSNLQRDFYNRLEELSNYDFNEFNIFEIKKQLNEQVSTGVKETILKLFDEFSHKYYYDETSKNIHMFNGWKSNSCYKINKKVITILNGFQRWNNEYDPTHYNVIDKLLDIEKVFNYLDSGRSEELDLREVLKKAEEEGQTKNINSKFFEITFYKKGTCHLLFKDLDLLKKFNIFGALNKGWLPPTYSKKSYKDMEKEEREAIDNFEGEKEYNKTMMDKEYFIYNENSILMLGSGL
ncbi:MAG: DUF4942 domain-containing protein [Peptostreptococcaceae bacterium]